MTGLGRLVPLFAVVDVDLILSCFRHLVFSWCATFCYSGTAQYDDEIWVNLGAERATQLRKVTKTSREWQMLTCVVLVSRIARLGSRESGTPEGHMDNDAA